MNMHQNARLTPKGRALLVRRIRGGKTVQRAAHLPYWIHEYNWHRPHASLGYDPPTSRLPLPTTNLLRLHT